MAVWAAVIFAGSSVPGSNIPGRFSVAGHFVEYAVLGALAFAATRGRPLPARVALMVLATCSLYAVSDELHQAFVPLRMPDPADWAVDTIGAAVGISAAIVLGRMRARRGAA